MVRDTLLMTGGGTGTPKVALCPPGWCSLDKLLLLVRKGRHVTNHFFSLHGKHFIIFSVLCVFLTFPFSSALSKAQAMLRVDLGNF